MSPGPAAAACLRRDGPFWRLEGDVTHGSVTGLLAEGLRSFEGNRPVVDCTGIGAADSSVLSLMLEWHRQLQSQGRHIAFTGLGANLHSLMHLYGIADLIPIAAE
ncbi:MAG TPA: STAS domain-containing protein [Burkholderiales bacterium]|jgi:phospholipid transport system transporter-binding protein|nr:STAS domain-containing protein [Burkholderiales bacterium]